MKDIHTENYKTLMNLVEDTNKWKNIWIGRITIVKMFIPSKVIYRCNVTPIKILMTLFTEIEKVILKSVWNHKRFQIAKALLSKKSKVWGIKLQFQTLLQSYSSQNSKWYWHKNRHVGQLNTIESPQINPGLPWWLRR